MKETYAHQFPGGITATATLDDTQGQPACRIEWSQFPPPVQLIPEYLLWRHTFLEDFARKTGQKLLVVDCA